MTQLYLTICLELSGYLHCVHTLAVVARKEAYNQKQCVIETSEIAQ